LRKKAQVAVAEVTANYPPNANGAWRLLPWYWWVHPVVPEPAQDAFQRLQKLADGTDYWKGAILGSDDLQRLTELQIPGETIPALNAANQRVPTELLETGQSIFFLFPPTSLRSQSWWSLGLLLFSVLICAFGAVYFGNLLGWAPPQTTEEQQRDRGTFRMSILYCLAIPYLVFVGIAPGQWAPGILAIVCFLLGYLLPRVDWPRNPLRGIVADLPGTSKVA
jgi:hypothetical protein